MGRMEHDAVVIATHEARPGGLPDLDAFRASIPEEYRALIVGPVVTTYNGHVMYAMLPDGSKEGWPASDQGDEIRERFKALFRQRYADGGSHDDWLHVRFGDPDEGDRIVERHRLSRRQPQWHEP
jgi:hypothetical protein